MPSLWADAAGNATPYTIKNGVVDPHTSTGYLRYGETCYWCHGLDGTNPERAGGASGYVDMGGWIGGQAEYVMVPYADFNCLKFPDKAQALE